MNHFDPYADLIPQPGEEVYVEWDEEFQEHGVFGCESGFCYLLTGDEEAAEKRARQLNKEEEA